MSACELVKREGLMRLRFLENTLGDDELWINEGVDHEGITRFTLVVESTIPSIKGLENEMNKIDINRFNVFRMLYDCNSGDVKAYAAGRFSEEFVKEFLDGKVYYNVANIPEEYGFIRAHN